MWKHIGVISVLFFSLFIEQTEARGGCFVGSTPITTASWSTLIQDLHAGDTIIGYNFSTGKKEASTISEIEIYDRDEYFRINKNIEVTAEHPFYIFASWSVVVRETASLQPWDLLISENGEPIPVSSIQKFSQKVRVYNLLNVEPTHNYYASGILVHNKWGGGGGGGGGSSHGSSSSYTPAQIAQSNAIMSQTKSTIASIFTSWNPILWITGIGTILYLIWQDPTHEGFYVIVMILIFLPGLFRLCRYIWRKIILLYRFSSGTTLSFTEDTEIIQFVKNIVPDFTGKCSWKYTKDTETWWVKKLKKEIPETEYSPFSRSELIAMASKIFDRYEWDWTRKNWENMQSYLTPEYFENQKSLFEEDFWENYDINFNPKIDAIIPIQKDVSDIWYMVITFQINANMVNFEINPSGEVVSGTLKRRSFTDHWNFCFDSQKKVWLLDGIMQI